MYFAVKLICTLELHVYISFKLCQTYQNFVVSTNRQKYNKEFVIISFLKLETVLLLNNFKIE